MGGSRRRVTGVSLGAVALLFGGCSSVSEFERSEAVRVLQVSPSFTDRILELQQRDDRPGLVALFLQEAELHRALGFPLSRADSLHGASSYESRPELKESYARQAVETLRGMPPSDNKFDRETREYKTVHYAMSAAFLALRNGDKVDVARGYAELVKPLCNAPVSRVTAGLCDFNSTSGQAYRQVMARLGDATAKALTEQAEQRERAELATLAALTERMRTSRRLLDHASAARFGAELSDQLAKRSMSFLAALIELDRAESFRAMGDAASAEASAQMARRRMVDGLGPSDDMLQLEAKLAAQLTLPEHAQRLQDEAAAVAALSTRLGIGSLDGVGDSFAEPQKLQEKRATLLRTIEQLQSRGAHLSAEYARNRLREVSAAYQTRVTDLAAERATAQRQRAEDERRDREGWEQLSSAIRSVQSMRSQGPATPSPGGQMHSSSARDMPRPVTTAGSTDGLPAGRSAVSSPVAQGNTLPPSGAPNTAGQMHSGSARDIPTTSQGSRQRAAVPAGQPLGNGTAAPASVEFSQRGEYVLVGRANAFRVYVENKTSTRGSCRVNGTYEYVSDSNGQVASNTEVLPIILPANGQAHADFSRGDRNVSIKEWKVTCRPF